MDKINSKKISSQKISSQDLLRIDGSQGGGQVLRTALALSTFTGIGFSIDKIRAIRDKPGLKNQHLHILKAYKELFGAKINGDRLGSEKVSFVPGEKKLKKNIKINIKTAGSMTLVLQSLILPLMFEESKTKITIVGGSDVAWSMPVDYFKNVFIPQMQRFAKIDFKLIRRGYFPKGNGKVEIIIAPRLKRSESSDIEKFIEYVKANTAQIDLTKQSKLMMIKGISHASRDLPNVAQRQADAARLALKKIGAPIRIDSFYTETISTGTGITLWAIFGNGHETQMANRKIIGTDGLGKKGLKAEIVGQDTAKNLIDELNSGAVVDFNMADNLIPYIALFGGSIKTSKITNHIISNAYVCKQFGFELDVIENECIIKNIK